MYIHAHAYKNKNLMPPIVKYKSWTAPCFPLSRDAWAQAWFMGDHKVPEKQIIIFVILPGSVTDDTGCPQ